MDIQRIFLLCPSVQKALSYCVYTTGIKMTRQTDIVILNDINSDKLKEEVRDFIYEHDIGIYFITTRRMSLQGIWTRHSNSCIPVKRPWKFPIHGDLKHHVHIHIWVLVKTRFIVFYHKIKS